MKQTIRAAVLTGLTLAILGLGGSASAQTAPLSSAPSVNRQHLSLQIPPIIQKKIQVLEDRKPSLWISGGLALTSVALLAIGIPVSLANLTFFGPPSTGAMVGTALSTIGMFGVCIAAVIGIAHLVRRRSLERKIRKLQKIRMEANGIAFRF